MTREEIIEALSKLGDNGHNGIDFDEWQAINAAIECLRTDGLWHPASELPPVDKETGLSDEVIAIQDRFFEGERVIWTRIVGSGWKHDNIKWWCYPPKEE